MQRLLRSFLALTLLTFFFGGQSAAQVQAAKPQLNGQQSALPVTKAWKELKTLRVCGDPNNLPFSDSTQQGFENKIAALIANELGDSVVYRWWPHRRGFVRSTLSASECDVIIGVPKGFDPALETKPYYRSTYYIVSRADRNIRITTLNDPAIKRLKIGVNLIGYDYTNTPPAEALAARGISKNVKGYSTFYGEEHRPSDIIDAVVQGDVDIALVWGPLAGYYAKRASVPLTMVALPDSDRTGLPFAYDMAIGVRHADQELRGVLDEILDRKRDDINQILREYNVPIVSAQSTVPAKPPTAKPSTKSKSKTVKKPTQQAASEIGKPAALAVSAPQKADPSCSTENGDAGVKSGKPGADPLLVNQSEYDGWKMFHVYCYRCHGVDALGGGIGPNLRHSLGPEGSVDHACFVKTVTDGRLAKGMPSWKQLLEPEQIENVWHYLQARSSGRLAAGRPHMATPAKGKG